MVRRDILLLVVSSYFIIVKDAFNVQSSSFCAIFFRFGIACDDDGFVTEINLKANNLTGENSQYLNA